LSKFLERLHDRLRANKQGLGTSFAQNNSKLGNRLKNSLAELKNLRTPSLKQLRQNGSINPRAVASTLHYLLVIITMGSFTFWVMRIAQIPSVPSSPVSGASKGMTLYSNQESASAYSLFGKKPLVTENIILKGVVVTSKTIDGRLDGFAIFEIDGKPTDAISVGENLGKGLTLQSIGDESATLLYEGQKLDFKLSKASKEKSLNLTSDPTKK